MKKIVPILMIGLILSATFYSISKNEYEEKKARLIEIKPYLEEYNMAKDVQLNDWFLLQSNTFFKSAKFDLILGGKTIDNLVEANLNNSSLYENNQNVFLDIKESYNKPLEKDVLEKHKMFFNFISQVLLTHNINVESVDNDLLKEFKLGYVSISSLIGTDTNIKLLNQIRVLKKDEKFVNDLKELSSEDLWHKYFKDEYGSYIPFQIYLHKGEVSKKLNTVDSLFDEIIK